MANKIKKKEEINVYSATEVSQLLKGYRIIF